MPDLCAIASHFSKQSSRRPGIFNVLWNCPSDLFEMSGVHQHHQKLEVMAACLFRVVHLFYINHSNCIFQALFTDLRPVERGCRGHLSICQLNQNIHKYWDGKAVYYGVAFLQCAPYCDLLVPELWWLNSCIQRTFCGFSPLWVSIWALKLEAWR